MWACALWGLRIARQPLNCPQVFSGGEGGSYVSIQRKKKLPIDTSTVYSQINKYILSRASCLPLSVYPMVPSIAGGDREGGPGGDRLSPSGMPMPASQVPSARRGSLERGRFEGAEASVLTDRAPVVRRHFNYSGRWPLQGREGHPGLQQSQHVAG